MRNKTIRIVSMLIALATAVSMVGIAVWATEGSTREAAPQAKYEKLDINELTNLGQDPVEKAVDTATKYFEKEWYEFITYSQYGVATLKVDEKSRIKFYDPYDYMSSMVMEVTYDDEIGWSSANEVTITHEFSESFSTDLTEGTEITTSREKQDGKDIHVETSESNANFWSDETYKEIAKTDESGSGHEDSRGWDSNLEFVTTIGTGEKSPVKFEEEIHTGHTQNGYDTNSSHTSHSETNVEGENHLESEEHSESRTDGWDLLADRITSSTGSSKSTTTSWSTTKTTSISRTFEAAYFNSNGAPLQWTIAHYEVKMPLKAEFQYKINGKWVTIETDYVLLTTMQGSCRAWQENSNVYYESWATGEPVTDADFWSGFFTESSLKDAYQTKLYPTG